MPPRFPIPALFRDARFFGVNAEQSPLHPGAEVEIIPPEPFDGMEAGATPASDIVSIEARGLPRQPARGLEFRSIDGTGNHGAGSSMNATDTDFIRLSSANYKDGISSLIDAPNARFISNEVVAGPNTASPEGASALLYAWGQFIDHDLDLTLTDNVTHIDITVPLNDTVFTPGGKISMTRSVMDPNSGHDGVAAIPKNAVTGWLDASMVYGSDTTTAASLRLADGRLAFSEGNNLPIVDGAFLAGDIRAQENPSLTALQTLFVREHNFQVERLKAEHPDWNSEALYQNARAIVTAEISHITYDEFLPHLLGKKALSQYHGYDSNVDSSISVEFAGAAYRFGHSLVTEELKKFAENGAPLAAELSLKDSFFLAPEAFSADGGADAILRYLGSDLSNAMDVHIVDDLRDFLFGAGSGLDLAALNIQRGRDLGLGSLNDTREAIGLERYTSFSEVTNDVTVRNALEKVYGSIDEVELWIGGLAEKHASGSMMGTTFTRIIADQFEALRDGDRLYYEAQGFDPKTLQMIKNTSLSDLILRNTDTDYIQEDAFVFYERHSGVAGGVAALENTAHQLVVGMAGVDTLTGGKADDLLVAAQGAQTLTGGMGADVFLFDKAGVNATITDFRINTDIIEFKTTTRLEFSDIHIRSLGSNAVIDFNGDHITLLGVNAQALSPHSFDIHML